jgi:hypothetical protein
MYCIVCADVLPIAVLALAANKADLLEPQSAAATAAMSEKDRERIAQVCT